MIAISTIIQKNMYFEEKHVAKLTADLSHPIISLKNTIASAVLSVVYLQTRGTMYKDKWRQ